MQIRSSKASAKGKIKVAKVNTKARQQKLLENGNMEACVKGRKRRDRVAERMVRES